MLERSRFIVKERVAFIKTTDNYDILDPDTQEELAEATEQPGTLVALLRFVLNKNWMPTTVEVRDKRDGRMLFSLHRGSFLFRARVEVRDADGKMIGYFRSKFLTFTGGLKVFDPQDKIWAEVKGGRRWFFDYHFRTEDGIEIGHVAKQLGGIKGIIKEMFTSADTFLVEVNEDFGTHESAKMLVLGAAIAIDMVFKEDKSGAGSAADLLGGI
jgi:uncharacterized protein YxjI